MRANRLLSLTLCAAIVLGWLQTCEASFLFYEGNSPITSLGSISPPYATLDVATDTVNGKLTFTLTPTQTGATFSEFGFNSLLSYGTDFSIESITTTVGLVTTTVTDWTPPETNKNMDGFGKFEVIVGNSSQDSRLSNLTMVLDVVTNSQATLSNFNVLNGVNGYAFAAHLNPFNAPANTGFIATDDLPDVIVTESPEPASLTLFGIGTIAMGGLGLIRRFRQPAVAAA